MRFLAALGQLLTVLAQLFILLMLLLVCLAAVPA